ACFPTQVVGVGGASWPCLRPRRALALARAGEQHADLARLALAQRADRQVGILEPPDRDAPQLLHRMADAEEHLANLPRAAFEELDRPPRVAGLGFAAAG